MRKGGLSERAILAALVAGQAARRLRRSLAAPLRLAAIWRAPAPSRLVLAPHDLRIADPTIADDIYGGYFVFNGKAVNTHGESPFLIEPPSSDWSQALLSFGWLRHLRAADTSLAHANARALVTDWLDLRSRPPGGDPIGRQATEAGWSVETVARRLMSWVSQSPLILEGADRRFYQRFMKSLARQAAWLSCALGGGLQGPDRLTAAIALAQFALCAEVSAGAQRRAFRALERELDLQILKDGGHVSRNPRHIVEALLDLLPLRQAFAARGVAPPQALLNAVDRMLPMLRLLRHDDGSLALFNGMGATRPEVLATLLAYEDSSAGALVHAPHSGYLRLSAQDVSLVVDVGAPPPRAFSSEAHAGALSFELSCGGERLIVNCGAPQRWRLEWREAARRTAAHSTLALDEASSARFAPGRALSSWLDGQLLSGPRRVVVERDADGRAAQATQDGYARRHGVIHRRMWRVEPDLVEGVDRLEPAPEAGSSEPPAFALRFHLHPGVIVQSAESGEIALNLPSGETWLFACDAPAAVETSVFFASPEGMRPTLQIVASPGADRFAPIAWRFARRRAPRRIS